MARCDLRSCYLAPPPPRGDDPHTQRHPRQDHDLFERIARENAMLIDGRGVAPGRAGLLQPGQQVESTAEDQASLLMLFADAGSASPLPPLRVLEDADTFGFGHTDSGGITPMDTSPPATDVAPFQLRAGPFTTHAPGQPSGARDSRPFADTPYTAPAVSQAPLATAVRQASASTATRALPPTPSSMPVITPTTPDPRYVLLRATEGCWAFGCACSDHANCPT